VGKLTSEVVGADRVARNFQEEAARLHQEALGTMQDIGSDAELIYSAHALKKTGRMSRGVTSRTKGNVVIVEVHAKDPKSGFDYVAVTRFGHKLKFIRSRRAWPRTGPGRHLAPIPGVGPRWVDNAPALQTPFGIFARVRGFRPKGDWAKRALPAVQRAADRQAESLGHGIVVRLSS
jgi:hypothetical protein